VFFPVRDCRAEQKRIKTSELRVVDDASWATWGSRRGLDLHAQIDRHLGSSSPPGLTILGDATGSNRGL
jgi:homoserine O-acetyltransferase